jgi:hypothetical protein
VFKLTPPSGGQGAWTETILHEFQGSPDGGWPNPLFAFTRKAVAPLYGTTRYGGDANGDGIAFKITQ